MKIKDFNEIKDQKLLNYMSDKKTISAAAFKRLEFRSEDLTI